MIQITEEQFQAFELVRHEGKYNMVMQADDACKAAGLTMPEYMEIISNYQQYKDQYAYK